MPSSRQETSREHLCILIRIPRTFRDGMSSDDLYEVTRGIWKTGLRREATEYAMAVVAGRVREVYRVDAWHPAGSTPYRFRKFQRSDTLGRWEFTGSLAPPDIRERYIGRLVEKFFPRGAANPIRYASW